MRSVNKMKVKEALKMLNKAITGEKEMKITEIKSCMILPYDKAFEEAQDCLKASKELVKTAPSDWFYWHFRTHEVISEALVEVFDYARKHGKDLPVIQLKDLTNHCTMDAQIEIDAWTRDLRRKTAKLDGKELYTCLDCNKEFLYEELDLCPNCGKIYDAVPSGCIFVYWGSIPQHCSSGDKSYEEVREDYLNYASKLDLGKFPNIKEKVSKLKKSK